MEILSDTTFRGKATFTKGFDVTGTSPVTFANTIQTTIGCLYLNNLRIKVAAASGPKIYSFDGGYSGTILTNSNIRQYGQYVNTGIFENQTIPSGCKKFVIDQATAKNNTNMNLDPSMPYIIQIRKVSTNELMDLTISGFGEQSEFIFERASTDEIPESYFKTTWIQLQRF